MRARFVAVWRGRLVASVAIFVVLGVGSMPAQELFRCRLMGSLQHECCCKKAHEAVRPSGETCASIDEPGCCDIVRPSLSVAQADRESPLRVVPVVIAMIDPVGPRPAAAFAPPVISEWRATDAGPPLYLTLQTFRI